MVVTPRGIQSFGPFELDASGELRKHGLPVRLQEQPRRVLEALLETPGKLVSRDELRARLWPDGTVVGFEDGLNNALNRLRVALGDEARNPRFVATIGRRGYRFVAPVHVAPAPRRPPVVAVLPLEDLAAEPDREYLADGMTDALITALAGITGLRVISRGSVMRFKGGQRPLTEVARVLGADVLVEGSLLRTGGRLRLNVRLIDGRSDIHVWARSYEREMDDLLAIQGELASAIAAELRLEVTEQEHARLGRGRGRVRDPAAHESWLKGRYWWNKRSVEGLQRGIAHYKDAIAADPLYAAAYAGLADCYNSLATVPLGAPPAETRPLAAAAAARALDLDPALAEAHASLGYTQLYNREWAAAGHSLERALELNPSYAEAHAWRGHLLAVSGRFDEAVAAARRAQALDPLSVYIRSTTGFLLHVSRRYDHADRELRAAFDLDRGCILPLLFLGLNLLQQGRATEAVQSLERLMEMSGRNAALAGWLAQAYAAEGRREAAVAIIGEIEAAARKGYVPPASLGFASLAAGDLTSAYRYLAEAIEERANVTVYFGVMPAFDTLRADPRFAALFDTLDLPGDLSP